MKFLGLIAELEDHNISNLLKSNEEGARPAWNEIFGKVLCLQDTGYNGTLHKLIMGYRIERVNSFVMKESAGGPGGVTCWTVRKSLGYQQNAK